MYLKSRNIKLKFKTLLWSRTLNYFVLFFQFLSTTSSVQCSNKSNHVKSSTIFDQARTFSERSNAKKNARVYVSDSDTDSDSDRESRKKVDWNLSRTQRFIDFFLILENGLHE